MKNFIIVLLMVVSIKALSQNFEGTFVWTISMEITDPTAKAQMEEAEKRMSDPETIKEFEERMNDPQFQAMMEQNPDLKAQMQKTLAMMKSGGNKSFIPEGVVMKVKGERSRVVIEGGIAEGEFISPGDNSTILLDHTSKTYRVKQNSVDAEEKDIKNYVVTKTTEKEKIKGYTCTKYIVKFTDDAGAREVTENHIWATTDIKGIDFADISTGSLGSNKDEFYKDIDGFPLRMVAKMAQGTMTVEIKDIKKESLAASVFEIPVGYTQAK